MWGRAATLEAGTASAHRAAATASHIEATNERMKKVSDERGHRLRCTTYAEAIETANPTTVQPPAHIPPRSNA